MNGKQLAAIAAILIVVIPIGMGYLLNFEETERTGWQTGEETNLSDYILNDESPFYSKMSGPMNNGLLQYTVRYPGAGVTETYLKSPDYFSVGKTVTSIPVVTSQVGTFDFPAAEKITTSGHTVQMPPFGNINIVSLGDEIPMSGTAFWFGSDDALTMRVYGSQVSTGETWLGPFVYDNCDNTYSNGSIKYPAESGAMEFVMMAGQSMEIYVKGSLEAPSGDHIMQGGNLAVHIWYDGDKYLRILTVPDNKPCMLLGSSFYIDSRLTFDNVSKIEYTNIGTVGPASNEYSYLAVSAGEYADPSAGWAVPYSENPHYAYWANSQMNKEITMYAQILPGQKTVLRAICGNPLNTGSEIIISSNHAGQTYLLMNTVTYPLGNYTNIQIVINTDGVSISGIPSWPVMGGEPGIFNTIHVADKLPGNITQLSIKDITGLADLNTRIHYRVDSVDAIAGSYASTDDFTFSASAVWPSAQAFALTLRNPSVYGDSLTIGETVYPVTDGAIIAADGSVVPLRNALISYIKTGDVWDVMISGKPLLDATDPTLTFNGVWSVGLKGNQLQQITTTSQEWVSGGFGLDKQGFLLVGILTAAACAVGLGMVGRPSGGKMAAILLVCIGGGAILMILV